MDHGRGVLRQPVDLRVQAGAFATNGWHNVAHFLVEVAELRPYAHFQEIRRPKLHRKSTALQPTISLESHSPTVNTTAVLKLAIAKSLHNKQQVFRRRQQDLERLTPEQIELSRKELAELERKFLERVAQTNRTKSSGGVKGA